MDVVLFIVHIINHHFFIFLLDTIFRVQSQVLMQFQEAISIGRVVISCQESEYDR